MIMLLMFSVAAAIVVIVVVAGAALMFNWHQIRRHEPENKCDKHRSEKRATTQRLGWHSSVSCGRKEVAGSGAALGLHWASNYVHTHTLRDTCICTFVSIYACLLSNTCQSCLGSRSPSADCVQLCV